MGKPIPNTPHAVAMCLPRWQDVIGYEEKNPKTMEKLHLGYPRFFYHPLVEAAVHKFSKRSDECAQLYTTRDAAERCAAYLWVNDPSAEISIRKTDGSAVHLIAFPKKLAALAKAYWQHAGEGISSRCAEALLNGIPAPDADAEAEIIKKRIAEFSGAKAEDIYLFPSGMAAIHAAYIAVRKNRLDAPTAQFAFPYGDTLKLQEKFNPHRALFYNRGDAADLEQLEKDLSESSISGLFCEFPSNPLLTCVDLGKLRELADQFRFPVIIDETLGACINQNTLPASDISAISLTKFFSGTSDVMGGALILNEDSDFYQTLRRELRTIYEPEAFYGADVIQLEKDSRDFRERVEKTNRNAQALSEYLHRHPAVDSVFYPSLTDRETYDQFRRPDGGYGGLLSFVLKEPEKYTEAVYDRLEITKGPNLGTSFSLCCPFVLIAHYDELEWAEKAGASRWLIRISIGIEEPEDLIARLERALP
ncbi:PLP-dependent transferase [Pontiella agarivorans]|uniref:PLP-dependent transferase n=1 Tax=Pontiella agarivorans TaxID=3038953 RepID=UPI002AD41403|nr:PLP-dependent transferase [Pontiella agarivorans]